MSAVAWDDSCLMAISSSLSRSSVDSPALGSTGSALLRLLLVDEVGCAGRMA